MSLPTGIYPPSIAPFRCCHAGASYAGGGTSLALSGCTVGPDWTRRQSMPGRRTILVRGRPPRGAGTMTPNLAASEPVSGADRSRIGGRLFHDAELTSLEQPCGGVQPQCAAGDDPAGGKPLAAADHRCGPVSDLERRRASYTRERISQKGVVGIFGGAGGSSGGVGSAGSFASMGSSAPTALGGRSRRDTFDSSVTGGATIPPFNLCSNTGSTHRGELDLWGRVRREVESADATVEASARGAAGFAPVGGRRGGARLCAAARARRHELADHAKRIRRHRTANRSIPVASPFPRRADDRARRGQCRGAVADQRSEPGAATGAATGADPSIR